MLSLFFNRLSLSIVQDSAKRVSLVWLPFWVLLPTDSY